MSNGSTTWTFTYDAGGMRTQRTNGSRTDKYVYSGGLLMQLQCGTANTLDFTYDAAGRPTAVSLNGTLYYYITNLQGDITAIVDTTGATVVTYTYDAWGNILSTTGTLSTTLGQYNPLRYRGYVYDQETGLYYLQTRYYNPEIGRFINGDNYPSTGQGFSGNNMFAYCGNNPVVRGDTSGDFWNIIVGAVVGAVVNFVSSVVSEVTGDGLQWSDAGKIATSTAIGAAEGATIAICPTAAPVISAAANATDTAIIGYINGDSTEKILTDSLVSAAVGAAAGSGGNDFVKGGKLINDAFGSVGNVIRKGVHPVVKNTAKKTIKKASKEIGRAYMYGQFESFAYGGISDYTAYYLGLLTSNYSSR